MSATSVLSPRSHGVLLSRLVLPTTILFAVTLFVVFTMILWTGDSANRTAAERERVQLTAAIEQTLDGLRGSLAQLVTRADADGSHPAADDLATRFGRRSASATEFDGAFLVAADGRVLAGAENGLAAGRDAFDRMRPVLDAVVEAAWVNLAGAAHTGGKSEASPFDLSLARFMTSGDATFAVAAVPLPPRTVLSPDEPAVAVAF